MRRDFSCVPEPARPMVNREKLLEPCMRTYVWTAALVEPVDQLDGCIARCCSRRIHGSHFDSLVRASWSIGLAGLEYGGAADTRMVG